MIQDPLTVSHQQREKRMIDRKLNAQRDGQHLSDAVPFLSWFEHYFHLDHWMQEFPKRALKVHLFACVFQHMFQGLLIVRSHLQRGIYFDLYMKKIEKIIFDFIFNFSSLVIYIWAGHRKRA